MPSPPQQWLQVADVGYDSSDESSGAELLPAPTFAGRIPTANTGEAADAAATAWVEASAPARGALMQQQKQQTQKQLYQQQKRRVQNNGKARSRHELHHHIDPSRPRTPFTATSAKVSNSRPVVATINSNTSNTQSSSSSNSSNSSSSHAVLELRQLLYHKLDRLLTMAVAVGPSVSTVVKQRALETGAGGRQIYSLAVSAKQLAGEAKGLASGRTKNTKRALQVFETRLFARHTAALKIIQHAVDVPHPHVLTAVRDLNKAYVAVHPPGEGAHCIDLGAGASAGPRNHNVAVDIADGIAVAVVQLARVRSLQPASSAAAQPPSAVAAAASRRNRSGGGGSGGGGGGSGTGLSNGWDNRHHINPRPSFPSKYVETAALRLDEGNSAEASRQTELRRRIAALLQQRGVPVIPVSNVDGRTSIPAPRAGKQVPGKMVPRTQKKTTTKTKPTKKGTGTGRGGAGPGQSQNRSGRGHGRARHGSGTVNPQRTQMETWSAPATALAPSPAPAIATLIAPATAAAAAAGTVQTNGDERGNYCCDNVDAPSNYAEIPLRVLLTPAPPPPLVSSPVTAPVHVPRSPGMLHRPKRTPPHRVRAHATRTTDVVQSAPQLARDVTTLETVLGHQDELVEAVLDGLLGDLSKELSRNEGLKPPGMASSHVTSIVHRRLPQRQLETTTEMEDLILRLEMLDDDEQRIRQSWGTILYEDVPQPNGSTTALQQQNVVELAMLPIGGLGGRSGGAKLSSLSSARVEAYTLSKLAASMRIPGQIDAGASTGMFSVAAKETYGGGKGRFIRITHADSVAAAPSKFCSHQPLSTLLSTCTSGSAGTGVSAGAGAGAGASAGAGAGADAGAGSRQYQQSVDVKAVVGRSAAMYGKPRPSRLTLSAASVKSIEEAQRKFQRYTELTSICGLGTVGMEPAGLVARLSEEIVDELMLEVANELGTDLDLMVDGMLATELGL